MDLKQPTEQHSCLRMFRRTCFLILIWLFDWLLGVTLNGDCVKCRAEVGNKEEVTHLTG